MSFEKHDKAKSKKLRPSKLNLGMHYRVASRFETEVILETLQSIGSVRALTVWLLFSNQEHEQLINLESHPDHYPYYGEDFIDSYLATNLLSKYKGLTLDRDLDEVAKKKFFEFEELCKETNYRLKHLEVDPLFHGSTVYLHNALIRKIELILGEFDPVEFLAEPDWGPGASTLIKRREASSQEKFQREVGITRDLHSLLPTEFLEGVYPHWVQHLRSLDSFPYYEVGNKVITVPKDAKTNRVIAVEPGINMFFQKSIGSMISQRLLRYGNGIKTGQARNQHLCKIASLSNDVATVDFSSASDSISIETIRAVLPPRWFSVMDSLRSHYGTLNGSIFKWDKFSTMGNGFTFELETLVFFAAALVCKEYHRSDLPVSAYGDDVILPSECYKSFSELVTFLGFRINFKKSFVTSPFRESCGSHYYKGRDCKPIFLKGKFSSVLTVYSYANAIRRLALRRGNYFCCDSKFRSVFDYCISKVPKSLRLMIPDGYGDGGFIGNFDEATPQRARFGIEGYLFSHFVAPSVTRYDDRLGYLLSEYWRLARLDRRLSPIQKQPARLKTTTMTYQLILDTLRTSSSSLYGNIATHDTRMKLGRSLVSQWTFLGDWI